MEKKTKIANFIKALIIIATAAVIVTGLSKILLLKSEDGINQFDAFYKQPENSIDVIFSGSSKVYCDIATGVLWDNYGIAAFDLGGAEAPSWVSYYQLKEALKTQHPKVICYEVSVAAMYDMLTQTNNWATDNNYGMKWNSNRIDQLRANSEEDEFYERLNPFNIMHGRYKDLEENDFTDIRNSADYKGFDPRERIAEKDRPENDDITDCTPCTEKEEEYIRKLIGLVKGEGIEIILFASPYCVDENEQRKLNYVGTIAESEGVEFIDYNRRYDELDIDFSCDMADSGHLNYNGNYKFTDHLGSMLKDKYDLPDRRGDERYVSWENDAKYQHNERLDQKILELENADDMMTLTDQDFIIFAINNDNAEIYVNNNLIDSQMIDGGENGSFRMIYEHGKDRFVFTESVENGNPMCSLFVNDKEYKEHYGNIIMIYDTVTRRYVRASYF